VKRSIRIALGVTAALALGLVIALAVYLVHDHDLQAQVHARIDQRTAYWTATVNAEVPLGASKDQATQWLRRRIPDYQPTPPEPGDEHALTAIADVIPEQGSGRLVCNEWLVLIDLDLGPDDRVISRRVHAVAGTCL
jgi:hypothetical protein